MKIWKIDVLNHVELEPELVRAKKWCDSIALHTEACSKQAREASFHSCVCICGLDSVMAIIEAIPSILEKIPDETRADVR